MFSRDFNSQFHKAISERLNLILPSFSSKNQTPGFEPVSGVARRQRRPMRMAVAFVALLAFFASDRAALAQAGYQFTPSVAVGASSEAQTITLTATSTGTVSNIQVLSGGAANLDYAAAGGSCAIGSTYNITQSCTVSVVFTAKYPGIRSGAVVLLDTNGVPMATTYLNGVGVGPLSVATAGEITTVAGNGHLGTTGSATGQQAVETVVQFPLGTAVDGKGNFYYTDSGNHLIGKVDGAGNLTIVAGTGAAGYSPDGTVATSAQLYLPSGIQIDGAGNVFFADSGNNVIREVVAATGLIRTVAGTKAAGYTGDGGAATTAELNQPEGLAFDASGNLFIADTSNNVIRKIDASTGLITTFAGNGTGALGGDGGLAIAATLNQPWGISFGIDGSMYIADFLNNVIRKIDTLGKISTVAGTGDMNYGGDGGPAISAQMDHPASVVVDAANNLYIADSENNVVRKVNGATQKITTLAGNGTTGSSGDGLNADTAMVAMNRVYGLSLDPNGNLYIADRLGLKVREILGALARIQFRDIKVTNTSAPTIQRIDNDGNAPLNISSITPVSNAAVDPVTTTCSTSAALASAGECNIGVEFKPTVVGSPVSGQINVNSDSVNTPVVIDLTGNSLTIEPSTTTLTSDVNPSAFGQAVLFTATISSLYTGQLRGTVQFIDTSFGNTVLGNAAVNSTTRTATLSVSTLALGVHQITAAFTDTDTNNTNSTSTPYTQTVKQATALALSSDVNPAQVYSTVTFTVAASETPTGGQAPTGNIVFSDSVAGGPLNGMIVPLTNGSASISTALLAPGSHSITATYAGDVSNSSATSNVLVEVIDVAGTTTTLTTSAPEVPFTTLVTFTATVTGNPASVPTGNVIFKDGTLTIGTAAVNSSGMASLGISTLIPGMHSITAAYQGDVDYAGSVSTPPLIETIDRIATSAAVVSSANPAIAGSTVSFTITVTAASSTTPNAAITGTVRLLDGGAIIGTGTISATGTGPATASVVIPVTSLTIGSHTITAFYTGDSDYVGSTSNAIAQVISLASTTNVLTASSTTSVATTPVTLTATLTSNGGTPTGSVAFFDGGVTIGSGTVTNGSASLTTATLAVGSHTITAVYAGDMSDTASTSNALTITIVARTTTVTLTSSQNPLLTLAPVTITATVADGGGAAATGTVSFTQDGTIVSTMPVSATGTATLQVASLPTGTHAFVATYSGDGIDNASTSTPLSELVQLRPTTDGLTTSATSLTGGQQITLISVVRWTGPTTPTGTVTFFSGTDSLATVAVDSTGVATVTVLLSGTSANLSSTYNGDQNYAPSTSATELVTIQPSSEFQMTATPPTFTLVSKQHASLNVTFASLNGFTDTLSLGCLGLPQATTCNFSKDQLLLAAGATQSVTLIVDTGNPLLAGTQAKTETPTHFDGRAPKLVLACFLPGGLLLGILGLRFRRLKGVGGLFLLLILASLSSVVIGCGTVSATGTPAGVYHFNISATGKTGVTQTLPVTMTVTQ